jgi:hypothetical protein
MMWKNQTISMRGFSQSFLSLSDTDNLVLSYNFFFLFLFYLHVNLCRTDSSNSSTDGS